MGNVNIQGAVPLSGAGYVSKMERKFGGGEYRRLSNAEAVEDGIINRCGIWSTRAGTQDTLSFMNNSFGIIGVMGWDVLYASATQQMAVAEGNVPGPMWAPTSLPVPAAAGSFHKIVHAFSYNGVAYWITWRYDAARLGDSVLFLYRAALPWTGIGAITFASLTSSVIATFPGSGNTFTFKNAFMQGERLWVATTLGVYFSKATDPTVWATPDGGFFKFPGATINFGFSGKNSVYVLCAGDVYSINYTSDPNTDATVSQLTNAVGGTYGCIHQGMPYFIDPTGLYIIYSTGVEKLRDANFDMGVVGGSTHYKLVSYREYLVVIKRNFINYDNNYTLSPPAHFKEGFSYSPQPLDLGYNVFFINTKTGAVFVCDYRDRKDAVAPAKPGYIVDAVVNESFFDPSGRLYFMTNGYFSSAGSADTFKGAIYRYSTDQFNINDEALTEAAKVTRYKPNIDIEVFDWSPDGNEYLMKRFRSLELMGSYPRKDFGIRLGFGNQDYVPIAQATQLINDNNVINTEQGNFRPPHPARIGLNQRARALSIRLNTLNPDTPLSYDETWDIMRISDIRALWTYTQRMMEYKTPSSRT